MTVVDMDPEYRSSAPVQPDIVVFSASDCDPLARADKVDVEADAITVTDRAPPDLAARFQLVSDTFMRRAC